MVNTYVDKIEDACKIIFDLSDVGIVISNPETKITLVNDALCNFFGYEKEEIYKLDWPSITHPDDLNKDLRLFLKLKNGEINSYSITKRYIRNDGGIFWAEISVSCSRNEKDEIEFFIAVVKDISNYKVTELRLQNQLDLSKSLNDRLDAQRQNFEEYTHVLTHDLRSPAGSISSLLQIYDELEDEEEKKEVWKKIKQVSQNMINTIDQTSKYLEEGEKNMEFEEFTDIHEVLSWVKINLSHQIEMSNARLLSDIEATRLPGTISIYQSVFQNLISNAIKYNRPEEDPVIKIKSFKTDDNLIVSFEDNGLGIDLSAHGHELFKRYKTFHDREDSHGIGLYHVKMQIESIGGEIDVESEVGKGSKFTISLPLVT